MNLYDFFENNSASVALVIVLTCWCGIFGYLWLLDNKVKRLEKEKIETGEH